MKEKNENTIQACLQRISGLIEQTTLANTSSDRRSLKAVSRTLSQLSSQAGSSGPLPQSDLPNDTLEKVSHYIELALNTFESIRAPHLDAEQQANFFFTLSETFETLGNYAAALRHYETTLGLVAGIKKNAIQGRLQYRMARIYSEMGEWQRAQDLLADAGTKLQASGKISEVALVQIELAKIAYRRGDYLKAQGMFEKALETSDRVGDIRSLATVSNHLGIIRRMLGEYDAAYEYFHKALIEFQSIQDFRGAAECLNNIGVVHLKRGQFQQGRQYFEKAHTLCKEIGNFPLSAFVYLNEAEYYWQIDDCPMATTYCRRALEYLVRLNNPIGIARTNLMFGRIFRKAGDLKTAESFFIESMTLYEKFCIPLGLANCSREYAQMLAESGRAGEAEQFETKAQELYRQLDIRQVTEEDKEHASAEGAKVQEIAI